MKLTKVGAWGLVGLMVVNLSAGAYHIHLQRSAVGVKRGVPFTAGESIPEFSGVDISGNTWTAADAPCRVIRLTDDDCVYCRKDKPSYTALIEAARRSACEVIEISPKAGRMTADSRPGVVQLKFVDADVGSAIFPFLTPTTLVVDGNWKLKWGKRGVFNDKSLAEGIAALNAPGGRGN